MPRYPKPKVMASDISNQGGDRDDDQGILPERKNIVYDSLETSTFAMNASLEGEANNKMEMEPPRNDGNDDNCTHNQEQSNNEATTSAFSTTNSEPAQTIRYDSTTIPPSIYNNHQRVYARDEATGLLYPAIVRRVMWGPKSTQVKVALLSNECLLDDEALESLDKNQTREQHEDDDEDEDEESHRYDPTRNAHHYYVHYMGWNVKWDRWVEEAFLYEDSKSTKELAAKLSKEYNAIKPTKKAQRMSTTQLNWWMKRRWDIEYEHLRMEKEKESSGDVALAGDGDGDNTNDGSPSLDVLNEGAEGNKNDNQDVVMKNEDESSQKQSSDGVHTETNSPEEESKKKNAKNLNKETLQRQAQLRERGLQIKRKRSHSERLHLPFTLKKVLVDEWEVITQCGMVHDFPSLVTVREALNRYLESKLALFRRQNEKVVTDVIMAEGNLQVDETAETGTDTANDSTAAEIKETSEVNLELEKEWINMVEGIAIVFDQALPVHLLFCEERGQYVCFRRQILAQIRNSTSNAGVDRSVQHANPKEHDTNPIPETAEPNDNLPSIQDSATGATMTDISESSKESPQTKPLPERMSEIYGCEHLLRLFVRLPSVIAATPAISEVDARRIFSKLGDLVRFLQKHQSELFVSSYRKPLLEETRRGKRVSA